MSDKIRYYMNKKKIIHTRKESWFDNAEKEEVYKKNFKRIKGLDDFSPYVEPKPKPKPKPKTKKSKKKDDK